MPGSSIRKTISISSKLYKEQEQATQQVAEILPDLHEPFSMTELEPVWNEYANQLQKQGRMTVSAALTKRKPELRDNFALVFAVDSAAAEKDLNDQKADLLSFLRKKLSNYKLSLSIIIATGDSADSKPYTPSEKFKKLAEKNPMMLELKKRFDLEIEY